MHDIAPSARISPLADLESSQRGSRLVIGEEVTIDAFVKVKFAGGEGDVVIGALSYLNSGTVIYSGNGVTLGRGVLIAANTTLAATNHEFADPDRTIREQRFMPSRGGIEIGDDCWIGANCVLLDGTHLGKGCIVAAGSVVRGSIEPYSVIGGNPARFIRRRGGTKAPT